MRQDINEISYRKYDPSASLIIIKGLVCKHQKIITLSENIENLYTYIALMQLLWNTLVICCTGFVIVIVSNNCGCYFAPSMKNTSSLFYCSLLVQTIMEQLRSNLWVFISQLL